MPAVQVICQNTLYMFLLRGLFKELFRTAQRPTAGLPGVLENGHNEGAASRLKCYWNLHLQLNSILDPHLCVELHAKKALK